jgi:hypothetical protein
LAREDHLWWATLADVTAAARAFLDPVLAAARVARMRQEVVALDVTCRFGDAEESRESQLARLRATAMRRWCDGPLVGHP